MTYSTEELILFLNTALDRSVDIQCACSPLRSPGEENPDWEAILKLNAKNSEAALEAYWQLREQIYAYQLEYQVSGLVSCEWTYRGKIIKANSIHDQLVCIPGDKDVLIKQTPLLIEWWVEVTQGMEFWHSPTNDREEDYRVSLEEILPLAPLAEWAEVSVQDELITEVNLNLCWGEPDPYPELKRFCAINSTEPTLSMTPDLRDR